MSPSATSPRNRSAARSNQQSGARATTEGSSGPSGRGDGDERFGPPDRNKPLLPGPRAPLDAKGPSRRTAGEARPPARGVTPPVPTHDQTVLAGVATAAARLCPGFTAGAVLHRTGKSVLLAGSLGRESVVVKCLLADSPHWVQRFRQEVTAYRTFTRRRPPVRVPRLIAADADRGVMVLEHVPGRPAARERHPSAALARGDVRATLQAVSTLNQWRPPAGSFPFAFDYPARIDRYHSLGLLTDRDAIDLTHLLRGVARMAPQFCHGDPVPPNILLTSHGPALLDWESAGYHLPGYDLAVLWTLLARDPMTRRHIVQLAQQDGSQARDAFLVNLMLVLVREIRLHDASGVGEDKRRVLRRLHDDCTIVRRAVRAAVGTR
jgi:hypothetical protein